MSFFQSKHLKDVPFYPSLGNHDCYIDWTGEIEYSKYNSQWVMPAPYYPVELPLEGTDQKMVVIVIDSRRATCKEAPEDYNHYHCKIMH